MKPFTQIMFNIKNKCILKFYLLVVFSIFCITSRGQVTIGSTYTPQNGVILDLKESDNAQENSTKGLLLPRVAITTPFSLVDISSANQQSPEQYQGLMVYNILESYLNCIKIPKGVMVWNKEQWVGLNQPIEIGESVEGSYIEDLKALKAMKDSPNNAGSTKMANWNIDLVNPENSTFDNTVIFETICGEPRVIGLQVPNDKNIKELDISRLFALRGLYCFRTSITSLDTSNNIRLEKLNANGTHISNINVENNVSLTELALAETNITSINLNSNNALISVSLGMTNTLR